jgi:multimeric flavodoxin WrbA
MQIVTVLGSPRRRGNTARALGWVEDQFRADRHDVDHANILDYNVGGCRECLICRKGGPGKLCAVDDDAIGIFKRMAKSDLVLLAAPVFCWGFPAQLKTLIDRTYCLMDFDMPRTDLPRLTGKAMGLLMTGGGERIDNADLVFRGFHHLVGLLRARLAGTWYVPNCTEPDALGEDVRRHAAEFARALVGKISS